MTSVAGLSRQTLDEGASFSLAPDGRFLAIIPFGHPAVLVDLSILETIGTLPGDVANFYSLSWSHDSNRVAYATEHGVFVYNWARDELKQLVTRQDLDFPQEERASAGFTWPMWSPDDRVVLFLAGARDWDLGGNRRFFLCAVTADGLFWKALSRNNVVSLSPDGSQAIIAGVEAGMRDSGAVASYLVDVVWR